MVYTMNGFTFSILSVMLLGLFNQNVLKEFEKLHSGAQRKRENTISLAIYNYSKLHTLFYMVTSLTMVTSLVMVTSFTVVVTVVNRGHVVVQVMVQLSHDNGLATMITNLNSSWFHVACALSASTAKVSASDI
jgi:hypothetical protein